MIRSACCRFPVTIAITLFAVLIHLAPGAASLLQTDFAAIAGGQWWRIWTGHLTHFGFEHLCWDLLMFAGLAGACEGIAGQRLLPAIGWLAAAISVAVQLCCPEVAVYRGLSGIDTGLFVWLAGMKLEASWEAGDWRGSLLWLVPCGGLVGKLLFEALSGQTLFVDSAAFTPLVHAHLGGLVTGIAIYAYEFWRRSRQRTAPGCSVTT